MASRPGLRAMRGSAPALAAEWQVAQETAPFARRLVAYAIVEGLFFSGAFCAIYWLKQRNLLPGRDREVEVLEHGGVGRLIGPTPVGEGDIADIDLQLTCR